MARTILVSLQGDSYIAKFDLNTMSGLLGEPEIIEVAGGPAPMTLSAAGSMLYVGLRTEPGIAVFSVDGGDIVQIDSVGLESDPCFVSLDRTGKYLFSTYYNAGMVTSHRLNADGTIQTDPIQIVKTYPNAHSIWMDTTNAFAFVPHTGPNKIVQFVFDAESGILSPNTSYEACVPNGVEPRHMAMDPAGEYFYCSNERDSSVTTYRLDVSDGTLAPLETVSTLPPKSGQSNSCAQIRISPNGRFLYVSNRGHDSIAVLKIDDLTHVPALVGHAATEKTPRAFYVDDRGDYLIAAGYDSGFLAVHRIDQASGLPLLTGTYHAGDSPMWVLEI
jgi:6-phosphogluconolactonase